MTSGLPRHSYILAGLVALMVGAVAAGAMTFMARSAEGAPESRIAIDSLQGVPVPDVYPDPRYPTNGFPMDPTSATPTVTPALPPEPSSPAPTTTTAPPPTTTKPKPAPQPTTQAAPTATGEVVVLVNKARAGAGCTPMVEDARLTQAAAAHSADMAAQRYFSHTSRDGRTFDQRIIAAGYPQPGAENIARGQRTAAQVMESWMDSPGHRANILNCSLHAIGVGLATNGMYWTQDFGY